MTEPRIISTLALPKTNRMRRIYLLLFVLASTVATAQTTITCDSILQTSTCAGGNVIVTFQTTGTFPWGNVFTAQLSDNWGSFAAPVTIGTTLFTVGGNGIIFATIPLSANFGFLYRVRVISSNPADTSNNSPNTLIVTQVAQLNQIVSNPGDSVCPGDTVTLFALNPAASYQWSTGDTTASIQVTQGGTYSVVTTDFLTCQSTAYDTVVFDFALCTGIAEAEKTSAFEIYPNPANGNVTFTCTGTSSDVTYAIYSATGQMIRNGALINSQVTIDVSGIPAGLYFVTLRSGSGAFSQRLIVE